MAYLAVNKDGTEIISEFLLYRNGVHRRYMKCFPTQCEKCPHSGYRNLFCKTDASGNRYKEEIYSDPPKMSRENAIELLEFWDNYQLDTDCYKLDYTVELPKGSIKKLIGRDMSWEDDPIELK